jgi:hypothetical protein
MKDPDFLADGKKQKLDVNPMDGEELAALIKKIYATPKPIVDKIVELIKYSLGEISDSGVAFAAYPVARRCGRLGRVRRSTAGAARRKLPDVFGLNH